MGQVRLTDADRLRLVVAVSILRSKPKNVSVSYYVLNLYATFPPSGPAPPISRYCWRTYALKLERDLQHLRESYEVQRAELLAAHTSSGLNPETTSSPAPWISHKGSDTIGSTKSSKKTKAKRHPARHDVTAAPQPPRLDPSNVSHELHDQIKIYFPRKSELLLALHAFEKTADEKGAESNLLRATLHVLRVAARILGSTLDHHPTTKDASRIATLGHVLRLIITSSLCPRTSPQEPDIIDRLELSNVDKIFDCLIGDIFVPVIRAFKRTSISFLLSLLSGISPSKSDGADKPPPDPHSVDLRPNLLQLFQTLVDSLRLTHSMHDSSNRKGGRIHLVDTRRVISVSSLRASLVLEVIRELERILFPTSHISNSDNKDSDTEPENVTEIHERRSYSRVLNSMVPGSSELHGRVARLFAKDTLWYLCSSMHILADLTIPESFVRLHPDIPSDTVSGCSSFTSMLESSVTRDEDGTLLLQLLHKTILSALYDLVLKCQPIVSQLQEENDLLSHSNSHGKSPLQTEDHHHSFNTVRYHGFSHQGVLNSQPVGEKYCDNTFNAALSLGNGAEVTERDSQEQGLAPEKKSEFGVPGGRDQYSLPGGINMFATAAGSHCHTDGQASMVNQGRTGEVIDTGGAALLTIQPELGVSSLGVAGPARECVIDEAGFMMLLGVVERYILDPEYTS